MRIDRMLFVNGTVLETGVDYLTLTNTSEWGAQDVIDEIQHMFGDESTPKVVKWGGYKGFQHEKIRAGKRARDGRIDSICTFTGGNANSAVNAVGDLLLQARCTRVDLQATIELTAPDKDLVRRHYDLMKSSKGYKTSMVGRRAITLYDSETGATLYVGKRSSRGALVRMYDKSVGFGFSAGSGSVWRFEVEFKREKAPDVLAKVLARGQAAELGLVSVLNQAMTEYTGVILPLGDGYIRAESEAMKPDTLAWLRMCVRPVVTRLCSEGRHDEVINALGLEWVSTPDAKMLRDQQDHLSKILAATLTS